MPGQTVLLTHEHADFDALASLLGGAMLFPRALPVLPRQLKRNAQAFLSLYRNQFPFIEPRHLPRGHVDLAALVDTRSVNAVQGMDQETGYLVIDRHAAGEASTPLPDVRRELAQTLTEAQRRLLWLVGETAAEMGQAVYVVGGFARDLLRGSVDAAGPPRSVDMDLVVEGDAIRLAERMQARCGGRVVTHARFGTAKWVLDESDHPLTCAALLAPEEKGGQDGFPPHLDFVTARTEFYTEPTALPTVEPGNIQMDLRRRDFTINALAIALAPERWGDLLDFYGGLSDLRAGVVRVLHSLSFVDDPTRIVRAVRYEQRFGFRIEARTEERLLDATPLLARVTAARVRHELERVFQEAKPEKAILRLDELGALRQIHPGLRVGSAFAGRCAALRDRLGTGMPVAEQSGAGGADHAAAALHRRGADAEPPDRARPALQGMGEDTPIERLYWGLLIYELLPSESEVDGAPSAIEEALSERLNLRGETRRLMRQLQLMKARLPQLVDPAARPSATLPLLEQAQPDALLLLSLVEDDPLLHARLRCYAQRWRHIHTSLNGNALQGLGLPPGPLYGEILRRVRAALLDGEIAAGAAERELAQAIIRDHT